MTGFLILICLLLIAAGIIFSVLPPLPGPVLSFVAMLLAHYFVQDVVFASWVLILWLIVVLVIEILDYTLPVLATKRYGGTKWGLIGGMIGMVLGIILPIPFGIILGPLVGAVVGDLYGGNHFKAAFRSGFGSFVGFLVATGLKLFVTITIGAILVIRFGGIGLKYLKQYL